MKTLLNSCMVVKFGKKDDSRRTKKKDRRSRDNFCCSDTTACHLTWNAISQLLNCVTMMSVGILKV